MAVEGPHPISRTDNCCFVQGVSWLSTARALKNDLQQATGVNVSAQTIRNRLHEGGLRARLPVVCPVLTAQHRGARLALCYRTPELAGPPLAP